MSLIKEIVQVNVKKAYDNRPTTRPNQPLAKVMVDSNTHPEVTSFAIFDSRSDVVDELVNGMNNLFCVPINEGKPYNGARQFSLGKGNVTQIDPTTGQPTNKPSLTEPHQRVNQPQVNIIPLEAVKSPEGAELAPNVVLNMNALDSNITGVHKSTIESGGTMQDARDNALNLIKSLQECRRALL